ncbi:lysine N(6)-hydroxylase/L-ornithine N(5)-oxygenase family protein [Falsibacillus pallidus]|uniref:lysine N(6)-hydroxylase/L-ornithine N(5)-oxygenase family protein n=1 Tax=Falsibacillus pallidus TaxID=493781 RepID=UPI003D97B243
MNKENIIDIIGIGIGPFNLSLAALMHEQGMDAEFFDQTAEFEWHPGMLIDGTDLQVPIIADLVTFANPKSQFTFMNYLHTHNRLYKYFFFNKQEVPRKEYNQYAKWVAGQLDSCHFGKKVVDVLDHNGCYEAVVEDVDTGERKSWFAKHIVMGTGSTPLVPDGLKGQPREDVFHSSEFLCKKEKAVQSDSITVIGSGQSASEIFLTLLKEQKDHSYKLAWFTRSEGILQLESSKIGQEFFSPDYIDYFHRLSFEQRKNALDTLEHLRNGIDYSTLNDIYDYLYDESSEKEKRDIIIQPLTEINGIEKMGNKYVLSCEQWQEEKEFDFESEKVVLATGYKPNIPSWFEDRFGEKIVWEDEKRFKVSRDYKLVFKEERDHQFFVLTNLVHSHGAAATNLGLSVERNISIINAVAGREVYQDQKGTIFSQFTIDAQK